VLSKEEKPAMKEEQAGFDQTDLDIAASSIVSMVLDLKGKEAFSKAVSSPEPVKALALVLSQFVETAITGFDSAGIDVSPQVWLSPDGALADAAPVLMGLAEKMGIQLDEATIDAVATEVSKLLVQRGESMQQEQGVPPPGGPAPSPMGGQPNVMG
jgi:hypothetical protein